MSDREEDRRTPTVSDSLPRSAGIGLGIFLLGVGAALLAERLGPKFDWLLPAILIAWGAGELYQRMRQARVTNLTDLTTERHAVSC